MLLNRRLLEILAERLNVGGDVQRVDVRELAKLMMLAEAAVLPQNPDPGLAGDRQCRGLSARRTRRLKVALGEACIAMGREQAAIAIAIVSAKPAEHFRSTPGGYFHGMVAKAKTGELNAPAPSGACVTPDRRNRSGPAGLGRCDRQNGAGADEAASREKSGTPNGHKRIGFVGRWLSNQGIAG